MDNEIAEELIEAGRGYENLFVPALFAPWTEHLLTSAGVAEGAHVLDVACGTGVLARAAQARVGRTGRVAGADPAPGMLAVARKIEPGIEWVLCSAEALDAEDGSFDHVVSQFGMMFFEDRQKATDEMFRVLKPGGSVAIATWRSIEHNPAYAAVISILDTQVSKAAGDALRMPFSLGEANPVVAALNASGFAGVATEAIAETATFPSTRTMVEAEIRGWLPLFDIHLDEEKISEVLAESDQVLKQYETPSGEAVFPTTAYVFSATKP